RDALTLSLLGNSNLGRDCIRLASAERPGGEASTELSSPSIDHLGFPDNIASKSVTRSSRASCKRREQYCCLQLPLAALSCNLQTQTLPQAPSSRSIPTRIGEPRNQRQAL